MSAPIHIRQYDADETDMQIIRAHNFCSRYHAKLGRALHAKRDHSEIEQIRKSLRGWEQRLLDLEGHRVDLIITRGLANPQPVVTTDLIELLRPSNC